MTEFKQRFDHILNSPYHEKEKLEVIQEVIINTGQIDVFDHYIDEILENVLIKSDKFVQHIDKLLTCRDNYVNNPYKLIQTAILSGSERQYKNLLTIPRFAKIATRFAQANYNTLLTLPYLEKGMIQLMSEYHEISPLLIPSKGIFDRTMTKEKIKYQLDNCFYHKQDIKDMIKHNQTEREWIESNQTWVRGPPLLKFPIEWTLPEIKDNKLISKIKEPLMRHACEVKRFMLCRYLYEEGHVNIPIEYVKIVRRYFNVDKRYYQEKSNVDYEGKICVLCHEEMVKEDRVLLCQNCEQMIHETCFDLIRMRKCLICREDEGSFVSLKR